MMVVGHLNTLELLYTDNLVIDYGFRPIYEAGCLLKHPPTVEI